MPISDQKLKEVNVNVRLLSDLLLVATAACYIAFTTGQYWWTPVILIGTYFFVAVVELIIEMTFVTLGIQNERE